MTHTGYISYDANTARLEDLQHRARRPRFTRERHEDAVAIRPATPSDRLALERLAALDSSGVPSGEVLIAEVAGEPRAAVEIAGGGTVADPFRRTKHAVELLTARAATLRESSSARRRLALRYRTA